MNRIVLIEGMDNTGKSTLIKRFTKVLDMRKLTYKVIHLEKPPKNIPEDRLSEYQHNYYINTVYNNLKKDINSNNYEFIIFDRAWISEYVYGPIYRNRDKKEIIEDNIVLETRLYTEMYISYSNVFLFVLISDNKEFLRNNEDNKSLAFNNDIDKWNELIDKEIRLFKEGYRRSLIDQKFILNVNDEYNNFKELLPELCNKLLLNRNLKSTDN